MQNNQLLIKTPDELNDNPDTYGSTQGQETLHACKQTLNDARIDFFKNFDST